MTGSLPPDGTVGISAEVLQVLLVAGLMKRFAIISLCTFDLKRVFVVLKQPYLIAIYFSDDQEQTPIITPSGFQFLLMDVSSQIWYFMLKYLDMVEVIGGSSNFLGGY